MIKEQDNACKTEQAKVSRLGWPVERPHSFVCYRLLNLLGASLEAARKPMPLKKTEGAMLASLAWFFYFRTN